MKVPMCVLVCIMLFSGAGVAFGQHTQEGSSTPSRFTTLGTSHESGYCHSGTSDQHEDEGCLKAEQTDSPPYYAYNEHKLQLVTTHQQQQSQEEVLQSQGNDKKFLFEEEKDPEEGPQEESGVEGSVWPLQQKEHLDTLIGKGSVAIIYFYKKSGSDALTSFLSEYTRAADDLIQYHIQLATVDCSEYQADPYCNPEKVDHFAYGFRETQEKIAFPIDTLFNANAIVASALHLALINTVPILQTAIERRDLEARCKGRCNIIFAFLRTLGTLEHRMFLEAAFAHQDDFVFAITTYTSGTLGLSTSSSSSSSSSSSEDEHETSVWALHCMDKQTNEECIVSHFRDKLVTQHLARFIHGLRLPLWHDLNMLHTLSEMVTPYDGCDLPWVVLVYDGSCLARVKELAPLLAQLLHGSVATLTLNLDGVSDGALSKLGLTRLNIIPPAIAFLHPGQEEEVALLNDYDDPLTWVRELLEAEEEEEEEEEEGLEEQLSDNPVQPLEELQHDDETLLGMVQEEAFTTVPVLAGLDPYHAALASDTLAVVAFYLSWDPVSNALLQHLTLVMSALSNHFSQATIYRIDCFDLPHVCNDAGVRTYPLVRIHPIARPNITYDGPIHRDYILRSILLMEVPAPLELVSSRELEAMMKLDWELHPACPFVSAASIGIFPSAVEAATFRKASHDLRSNYLLGLHISTVAVYNLCESSIGCVVVSKPSDRFQPRRVLNKDLDSIEAITLFIKHAAVPVLAQLDPERFYALVGSDNGESIKTSVKHLAILFLPANSTQSSITQKGQHQQGRTNPEVDGMVAEDDWGSKIGHLAAEMAEPGFVFSWLLCVDPMAVELLIAYGLSGDVRSLVALSIGPDVNTLHLFPSTNTSQPAFRDWFTKLRAGQLPYNVELPEGDWQPRLEGFDFLKFMREDQDHDAEEHLIMEMEADLSSSPQQQNEGDGNKKYFQEEL